MEKYVVHNISIVRQIMTFVSFISYSLPYYDFSPKGELIIFEDTRSIVINDFLYTLKFDN